MNKKWTMMATIQETYNRAAYENLGISRNFIREAVLTGKLPCVMAGTKRLINWNVLLDFLGSGNSKQSETTEGQIRALR